MIESRKYNDLVAYLIFIFYSTLISLVVTGQTQSFPDWPLGLIW